MGFVGVVGARSIEWIGLGAPFEHIPPPNPNPTYPYMAMEAQRSGRCAPGQEAGPSTARERQAAPVT